MEKKTFSVGEIDAIEKSASSTDLAYSRSVSVVIYARFFFFLFTGF